MTPVAPLVPAVAWASLLLLAEPGCARAQGSEPAPATPGPAGEHPGTPAEAPGEAAQPPGTPAEGPAPAQQQQATPAAGPARTEQRPETQASETTDEDDEANAARALQRSLVQRGALLLPVWGLEIVPELSYAHSSLDSFQSVARLPDDPGQPPTVNTLRVSSRTHQLTTQLTLRLGLPWELQIEAASPFVRVWRDVSVLTTTDNANATGLGDPRLSLTRQIVRGRKSLPDVLITGSWMPPVGSSPFDRDPLDVDLGTGFHEVEATVTATKASDPLVFLANASYTFRLDASTRLGRVDPGDSFGVGGGAILAVSPETSMSFLFDFQYVPAVHLAGSAAAGIDETVAVLPQTLAVLQLGLAYVLSRRTLLNVTVGMGLTDESPDFQLGFSLPLRF